MSDIVIQGLCKRYGDKTVLSDFSATLPAGGVVGLMGPSGCGKTTLLNILMGLAQPDAGSVTGVGQVSCVFQEDRLAEDFTSLANLMLLLPPGGDSLARATRILADLGLADSLTLPVRALSGGMKRRVAIARALIAPGDWILMDEPFKGLDTETRAAVIRYILGALGGRSLLVVSHDAEELRLLSATVITMTPAP